MTDIEPTLKAQILVAQYYNQKTENVDRVPLVNDDVYLVWFCYILGGWKALVSTTLMDNMYYEVTYNKQKNETYLDAYMKVDNIAVVDGKQLHDISNNGGVL